MFTLGTHFDELLKNLQPPQDRLDAARDLPPLVRTFLAEHPEFATVSPHSRLAGSYAQDMSVGDVKDVDFLVRVPGDPEANDPEASELIRSLRRTLNDLPDALGYQGSAGIDIELARRSVHVYFKGHDFHLDVVPCIAPEGFDQVLYVPDRGFNRWIASHPLGYVALLTELNQTYGLKVKPLGRLLKHFRNYQMQTRKPKSYWLGALLVHHIQRDGGLDMAQPLAVLFRDLLDAIYCQYSSLLSRTDGATPNVPDPMLGHNVSWNWSRTHFETFMRRLDDGRRWASQALESTEREAAIKLWQRIFGEAYFPSDVVDATRRLAVTGRPGTATVTPLGLILPAAPAEGRTTHVPRTTFHGSDED